MREPSSFWVAIVPMWRPLAALCLFLWLAPSREWIRSLEHGLGFLVALALAFALMGLVIWLVASAPPNRHEDEDE